MSVTVPDTLEGEPMEAGGTEDSVPHKENESSLAQLREDVDGVGPTIISNLRKNGFTNINDIRHASTYDVCRVSGIGPTLAVRILEYIEDHAKQLEDDNSE